MLKIFKVFLPFLTDNFVQRRYENSGKGFGDNVSYIYMGECIGFENHLNKWADWEKEYANRGYRTVSLDNFVKAGGYGKPIDDLLSVKRSEDEVPILYAKIYRERYLGKIQPVINLEKLLHDGEVQTGTYQLPTIKLPE